VGGSGLRVEESDNTITVGVGLRSHPDLLIQAPFSTSVKLSTVNGSIEVNRLTGDLEISTTNGAVTASHISGSAVFHSLNGKILAAVEKISADKPMSFSSLNGDIDVTFPADVKARVKLKTHNGEVYSDFDVHLESTAQTVVENKQSTRGRYRVRSESTTYGNINGGGPEIQFTTFNGTIYIRKAK